MFADDAVIFSDSIVGPQSSLKYLEIICFKWNLTVNIDKNENIFFRKGGQFSNNERWTYGGLELEIVSSFKTTNTLAGKVIRHFVKSNSSTSPIPPLCSALPNGNNQWHFNNLDKANCLNDYFASISTVNDEHTELPSFSKFTDNSLSQIHCTEHEIENIIEVLNPNKASGDDGISHKMLKGVSKSVSKPLCILLNRSFDEGIFPDTWKLANVIPIFKKGDKSQPCK